MTPIGYFMIFNLIVISILGILMLFASRRMKRNEPVWGWKRKQFLEEQQLNETNTKVVLSKEAKQQEKEKRNQESIVELMELKDIGLGIIERERNEYLLIIETDFVNFDLLQVGERTAILEGYQQLYNTVNFDLQMLVQAVRQDFSKDKKRFDENLLNCNEHVKRFNESVIKYIGEKTENDFRITMNVYYVVKYSYEPSKFGKLTKEQRLNQIRNNILMRANIVKGALRRARVEGKILDTLEAAEVLKRALNRDRMLIHPIEDIEEHEKLVDIVTLDYASIPEFKDLVHDVKGALEIVGAE